MGRRNSRTAISKDKRKKKSGSETLIPCQEVVRGKEDKETAGVRKEGKGGFFACYLLTSLSPRHKGRTYIGFTVNPRRRIRQHNGEIGSGASRTKSRRPWEMVFCIYGFPTHVSALQFEWAWQHPRESLAVRDAAATLKSLTGLANKIRLAYKMLTLPAWENLNLTVNFFSTKYTQHSAGCPSLPKHMRVQVCSLDELPCYTGTAHNNVFEDEEEMHNDEMSKNISNEYGSGSEGSTVAEFGNWRRDTEETTHNQNGVGIQEADGRRQSEDSLSSTLGERQHPLFTATTTVHESSSISTSSFSASEGSKNGEAVTLIEEDNGVELDQPIRAVEYDEPSILTSVFSREVDVVDLISPSPGYRIMFSSKKREVSDVCPETIDLTQSPIFV